MPTDAFSLYVWIPWRCCICSTWTDRLRAVRIQSTTPMRKKFCTRTSSGNPVIYYSSDPSLCCRKILFLLTISQQFISSSYFKLIYFPSKLKGEDTCLLLFFAKDIPMSLLCYNNDQFINQRVYLIQTPYCSHALH